MPLRATYRLQLHGEFDLRDATDVVPYLAALGVSHAYVSPVLQAAAGSTHGYDVVDHERISDQLGGRDAFDGFTRALSESGLELLVDIVPNHMAIAPENRWFRDVLEHGPSSRFAGWFDVDWDPPERYLRNRILVPVLGERYGEALEAGHVALHREHARFEIRYFEHVLPASPRSIAEVLERAAAAAASDDLAFIARSLRRLPPAWLSDADMAAVRSADVQVLRRQLTRLLEEEGLGNPVSAAIDEEVRRINADPDLLDEVLEEQNFRLAYWRAASHDLDYRRFFDIDTLIGLRVEDAAVFDATHGLVLGLVGAGTVTGLRIDHPDGLRDPAGYTRRLRERAPGAWILVEKILEPGETLPESWPVDGTTGYDFIARIDALVRDPDGVAPMQALFAEVTGEERSYEEVEREAKRQILDDVLAADLGRLAHLFVELCESRRDHRDFTRPELAEALAETLVAMADYRTYVGEDGEASPEDRARVDAAIARAAARRPELDRKLFDLLGQILRGELSGEREAELRMRFQQLSGPVMAKGVEDTTLYRWVVDLSANEVGGAPGVELPTQPGAFHDECSRAQERWPSGMLALSTHDTKRSEDVRARLSLLSQEPEQWAEAVRRWREMAGPYRSPEGPDPAMELLLFQTIVGAHPIGEERLASYALKAAREAKQETSWLRPDEAYEAALGRYVSGIAGDPDLQAGIASFVAPLVGPGRTVSLAQKLLQLTAPGVPDLYQGTELWDLSLVDPDNRRPVDHALLHRLLAELEAGPPAGEVMARADEGLPKLWLVHQALATRRLRPEAFGPGPAGSYRPLDVQGPASLHAVAFSRGEQVVTVVPRLVLRLGRSGGWKDTTVELPEGDWEDRLTGARHGGGPVALSDVLAGFPVALLVRGTA